MNSKKDQNNPKFSRVYTWFFPIWWSSVPSLHWTPDTKCLALILYRHTPLYLNLLPFYTLKVCDGLLSSNFYQHYLSTAFVHLMSLCCTLVILTIILNFSFWLYFTKYKILNLNLNYKSIVPRKISSLKLDPDLHTNFSRGRSGGLVFPSLSEFSTVDCDPHIQRLWHSQ